MAITLDTEYFHEGIMRKLTTVPGLSYFSYKVQMGMIYL